MNKGTRRPAKKTFKKIIKISKTNYNRIRYKTLTKERVLRNMGFGFDKSGLVKFATEDGEVELFSLGDIGIQMKAQK